MNQLFILPGDTYTCTNQTLHFHKGMKYEISKCFQRDGNLIVLIKNKYDKDIIFHPGNFERTAKTATNQEKRLLETDYLYSGNQTELKELLDRLV